MEVLLGMEESAKTGSVVRPESRFALDPLPSGYYSEGIMGRGDAERSLMS